MMVKSKKYERKHTLQFFRKKLKINDGKYVIIPNICSIFIYSIILHQQVNMLILLFFIKDKR